MKTKEYIAARSKRWNELNIEKVRKSSRESYHRNKHKNREQNLKRASNWYYKNKDRILPRKRELYRKTITELKEQLFQHYGKKCNCCNIDEIIFLTIDHKNHGKGNAAPKGDRHMIQFLRRIIELKFPKDYQILCINCNWAKGVFGKCPHDIDRINRRNKTTAAN